MTAARAAPLTFTQNCSKGCSGQVGDFTVPSPTGNIGVLGVGRGGTGATQLTYYQPASRFWEFQSMDAGIFVALTLLALGAAMWLLHRRAV